MSLITDAIFVRAIHSNASLMSQLPAGDVYNTAIALPDVDLDNAKIPYVIVSFDGLQNDDATKDSLYEGSTDKVQIGITVAAQTRPQLGRLVTEIRKTIREFFENITDDDNDYSLVPTDYQFTAQAVQYDSDRPCYWQMLNYQCDVTADNDE